MALPIPCKARQETKKTAEGAIAERRDETAKVNTPYKKILFLPCMSAIRPKGTKNIAAERNQQSRKTMSRRTGFTNRQQLPRTSLRLQANRARQKK